jgi:two-component system response regulator ChvI
MTTSNGGQSVSFDNVSAGAIGEMPAQPHIVLVDDDDLYSETLGLRLTDLGYTVTSFSGGSSALDHFASGGRADVVLLDWQMPGINGLEVLRRLRRSENVAPVIVLTGLEEDTCEEAALENGAADFIVKSRSLSILVKRLRLIADGARPGRPINGRRRSDIMRLGRLELRFDINRAHWADTPVSLTLTEFKILALLARRAGEDVPYREIYDVVHGKSFTAGDGDAGDHADGDAGDHANVRTLIKRIRKKFRAVDPDFERIQNYAGFGYRWMTGFAERPEG